MDYKIISPTIQEFLGLRYYLCGEYFQRNGVRLHTTVWRHYKGEPPKGKHVHHKDRCKANNHIDNLECLTPKEHAVLHGLLGCSEKKLKALKINQPKAVEGNKKLTKKQRSIAAKRGWLVMESVDVACKVCGKTFKTPFPNRAKFCGITCRMRDLRDRNIQNGLRWDGKTRTRQKAEPKQKAVKKEYACRQCSNKFLSFRHEPKCCSNDCSKKYTRQQYLSRGLTANGHVRQP
jgi:hypothetical protein